jgi:hypothetical protein
MTITPRERVLAVLALAGLRTARLGRALRPSKAAQGPSLLPVTGKVEVADKLVRFVRPGLIEE